MINDCFGGQKQPIGFKELMKMYLELDVCILYGIKNYNQVSKQVLLVDGTIFLGRIHINSHVFPDLLHA